MRCLKDSTKQHLAFSSRHALRCNTMKEGSRSASASILTSERVRAVCVSMIVANFAMVVISFFGHNTTTPFGTSLGGDFPVFYYAGVGLNRHSKIYQSDEVDRMLAEAGYPESPLPFLYPPFFATLFRPLALLKYSYAYAVWIVIVIGAYLAAFEFLWPVARLPENEKQNARLVVLAFAFFQTYSLAIGQQSWFGFLWFAIAQSLLFKRREFLAGVALSACLYKPPLLLIIAPALVLRGRFKIIGGLLTGSVFLALLSLIAVGASDCSDYATTLLGALGNKSSVATDFPLWKYVDIVAFSNLLIHRSVGFWVLVPSVISVIAMRPRLTDGMAWSLPINIYVPIYDVSLVAIPALLFHRYASKRGRWLYVILFCAPWVSEFLARKLSFQPITLLLLVFAIYCSRLQRTQIELKPNST